MKKHSAAIVYTDSYKQTVIGVSESGISLLKEFIPTNSIESIIFTNVPPKINGVYATFENETYIIINYLSGGENKTVTVKTYPIMRKHIKKIYSDKVRDNSNGKAFNPFSTVTVFGDGFSENKKESRFLHFWHIAFVILFIISIVLQRILIKNDAALQMPLPVITAFVFIAVESVIRVKQLADWSGK